MKDFIAEKITFVENINKALTPVQKNIEKVEYRVFRNSCGWEKEYLIINYDGGARTVRNSSGNSCGAIFEEIAKYLFSGYYNEERYFTELLNDPDWVEVFKDEEEAA